MIMARSRRTGAPDPDGAVGASRQHDVGHAPELGDARHVRLDRALALVPARRPPYLP